MNILIDPKADEVILFRKLPNLISQVPADQVQSQPKSCNVTDDLECRSMTPVDTMIPFAGHKNCNSQAIEQKLFPLWGSRSSITKSRML